MFSHSKVARGGSKLLLGTERAGMRLTRSHHAKDTIIYLGEACAVTSVGTLALVRSNEDTGTRAGPLAEVANGGG